MKFIISFLILFSVSLYAQSNIKVIYEFTDYGGYRGELELFVKDNLSSFIFHKDPATLTNEKGWEFYHYFEHYENYYDRFSNEITETRLMNDKEKTLVISLWQLDLKWKITNETKEINGYTAQKAICESYNISGRGDWNYGDAIAWFTTDIPIGVGPERYYGLPGLIVFLEFSLRSSRSYLLKKVVYDERIDSIEIPKKGIQVSKAEIVNPGTIDKQWLKKRKKELE